MHGLQLREGPDADWESFCHGCGLCCYERNSVAGGVRIDLTRPCPYLDTQTNRCTMYADRFKVAAYCSKVTLLHALFGKRMPLTCGYVQRYRRFARHEEGGVQR